MEANPASFAKALDPPLEPGLETDDDLARRSATSTEAFAELYLRHRDPVFRYLRARCRADDEPDLAGGQAGGVSHGDCVALQFGEGRDHVEQEASLIGGDNGFFRRGVRAG